MGNLSDGCVLLFCQVEATAIRIRDQREAVEAQLEAFGFNILTATSIVACTLSSCYPLPLPLPHQCLRLSPAPPLT